LVAGRQWPAQATAVIATIIARCSVLTGGPGPVCVSESMALCRWEWYYTRKHVVIECTGPRCVYGGVVVTDDRWLGGDVRCIAAFVVPSTAQYCCFWSWVQGCHSLFSFRCIKMVQTGSYVLSMLLPALPVHPIRIGGSCDCSGSSSALGGLGGWHVRRLSCPVAAWNAGGVHRVRSMSSCIRVHCVCTTTISSSIHVRPAKQA
jgi:hypothetical protein